MTQGKEIIDLRRGRSVVIYWNDGFDLPSICALQDLNEQLLGITGSYPYLLMNVSGENWKEKLRDFMFYEKTERNNSEQLDYLMVFLVDLKPSDHYIITRKPEQCRIGVFSHIIQRILTINPKNLNVFQEVQGYQEINDTSTNQFCCTPLDLMTSVRIGDNVNYVFVRESIPRRRRNCYGSPPLLRALTSAFYKLEEREITLQDLEDQKSRLGFEIMTAVGH